MRLISRIDRVLFPTTEPEHFIGRAIFGMRWMTLAALLVLTLMQPQQGFAGISAWALILLFAIYNLLTDLLRGWLSWSHFNRWRAVLDLIVAGVLYSLGPEPGGALFLLFFLAVTCAAATLSWRASLFYTAITLGLVTTVDLVTTTVLFTNDVAGPQHLGARLVFLGLVGVGITILVHGLIKQQETIRSERAEAEQMVELERVRAEFISIISHELRTPLTALRASLGLLADSAAETLTTEQANLMQNARRNVERLHLLIDDLLTYNQIEAGALNPEQSNVDLREVVANVIAAVQPLLQQKGQQLVVELPVALPIQGDARRLEQVLGNLLINAHRHTPRGTRIALSGRVTGDEVRLSVQDNGPGVAAEEVEAIFQRFHRISTPSSGTGLGLAIARQLVEMHGGRTWAESSPGAGLTVHIVLPSQDKAGIERKEGKQ